MTPLFRDRCQIVYTDTDSLIYHVECDDVYETMKRDIDRYDTSDYPANNAYGMPLANKKVPGLMKDENNGAIMIEFVGLRAKMYALRVDGKRDTKKAKGVKSSVVARTISFDDYTRCLKEDIEMTRRQACIRSKLHRVYTVSEKKIALSPYDDKRYVARNCLESSQTHRPTTGRQFLSRDHCTRRAFARRTTATRSRRARNRSRTLYRPSASCGTIRAAASAYRSVSLRCPRTRRGTPFYE
ncbi:hypothetical protein ALC62_05542 [Cyphomyrmex costatus]|uniref:DNA-directed DNA polymerase n=1 Tax=Cyphomyrmex costatus TaxID=456900 RepID=A0A151K329_9HYME|nr:hypothetical protein ALC62_05542 [Cyphomyrmex costatus]